MEMESTSGSPSSFISAQEKLICGLIVLIVILYWHWQRWCQLHKVILKGSITVIRPPRTFIFGHSRYFNASSLFKDLLDLQRKYGPVIALTTASWQDCLSLDQFTITLWTLLTLNLSAIFPLSERLQAVQDEIITSSQSNNCVKREGEEMVKAQIAKARSRRVYLISEASIIRDIMSKRPACFKRFSVGVLAKDGSESVLSRGLYHAEGSQWLALRRMTAISFSKQFLQKLSTPSWQTTEQLVQSLIDKTKGRSVLDPIVNSSAKISEDIYVHVQAFSLRFMLKIILGIDSKTISCNDDDLGTVSEALKYLLQSELFVQDAQQLISTSYNSDLSRLSQFKSTKNTPMNINGNKATKQSHDRIDAALHSIIQERLQTRSKPASTTTTSIPSMLDNWIPRLSDFSWSSKIESEREKEQCQLLIDCVKSVMISGVATSAIVIAHSIQYMTKHREVLQRLKEEAITYSKQYCHTDSLSGPTLDSLNGLSYTEGLVNEVIRLKSPSSILAFEPANQTDSVSLVHGLVIQPQDVVLVHLDAVMRNNEIFSDADQFQPDRWLTNDMAKRGEMHEHFLLAFGLGTRVCPGQTLAKMHMYFAIVLLATYLDFST
jgi:cytochrome P450